MFLFMNVCITYDSKFIINEKGALRDTNLVVLGEEVPRRKTDSNEGEQTSQAKFRGRDRKGRSFQDQKRLAATR